jgi:hypothetical protein
VILQVFDRIYVINLAARTDRRRDMVAQLRAVGIAADDPGVEFFAAVRPDAAGGFPTIGARGCFLSHLAILNAAAGRGIGRFLILEDDLNFAKGFAGRFAPVAAALAATDWSIFYGDGRAGIAPGSAAASPLAVLEPSRRVETTHFIGFQPDAAAAAADYLATILTRPPGDPLGGPMHVDGAYSWLRRANPQLRTVIANPPLGYQRPSRTDVHPNAWHDRTFGVRHAASMARRIVNALR